MATEIPAEFVRPDLPSRCTWSIKGNDGASPHTKKQP